MPTIADLEQMATRDVHLWAMTAPFLGKGQTRRVVALDADHALKVTQQNKVCNQQEAALWQRVAGTPLALAFAAVIACAEDGAWLVMERADRTLTARQDADDFMDRWPNLRRLLGSPPAENVGVMRDGRLAIIDYAGHRPENVAELLDGVVTLARTVAGH